MKPSDKFNRTGLEAYPQRRLKRRQQSIVLSPKSTARQIDILSQNQDVPSINIVPPSPDLTPYDRSGPGAARQRRVDRELLHPADNGRRQYHKAHRCWVERIDSPGTIDTRARRNAISSKSGRQNPGETLKGRLREAVDLSRASIGLVG
ncbi:hypothetical protein Slin15195_G128950 [Septoria linicola]|uniref:Uncharacterized protein n=1 Tax=Septoria linicola TaxID=215465 RepID=A0A9Q9BAX1_9PEZI|nr:hypothetical protein Slin14017_G085150 [Septoria linicola]USW59576.1 hypothetical protein Slin15195_G128950 [Septoria linicola]